MRLEKRILVVDDDDAIRTLVSTVLRRRGFRVDVARNGADALEQTERCRHTLIILDLMMPRLSGYDVLDRLATRPPETRPVVLVLTAGIQSRNFDPSLVVGTIQKPFDIELLIDTVSACLAALRGHPQPDDCPPLDEILGWEVRKPS